MSEPGRDGRILCDRYLLQRELGRGAMGVVYEARDLKHDRIVAVKVMAADRTAALDADRFLAEIRTAARLSDSQIVPVYDSGDDDGTLFYVMPRVEGESLRDRLDREGGLPVGAAVELAGQVADGLAYAHARGVVHRDIKPANILIDRRGHACIADFGLARAVAEVASARRTADGTSVGSPAYMSPEQATGAGDVDGRSDVYSLACVLFEMLTGEPPFTGTDTPTTLRRHLSENPPSLRARRADVSRRLDQAIRTALAKDPDQRFSTATAFARAIAQETGASAKDTASTAHGRAPSRTARIAAVIGIAVAVAGGVWLYRSREPEVAPTTAATSSDTVRVAVLPFDDAGPDQSTAYFANGLTAEILYALDALAQLRVTGRSSAYMLDDAGLDTREIARRLEVDFLVDGLVRLEREHARVDVWLVDGGSGAEVWSHRFDRAVAGVLALQEEIAMAVARELLPELPIAAAVAAMPGASLTRPTTGDPLAHDHYLRGRAHWFDRRAPNLRKALEEFERAVELDPGFARAHAAIADVHNIRGAYDYAVEAPADAYAAARRAADSAIALAPELGAGHAALAVTLFNYDWNWKRAEREFLEAIRLDPSDVMARHWYALLLRADGRHDEANRQMASALQADRFSGVLRSSLARQSYFQGRHEQAVRQFHDALAVDPNLVPAHLGLGLASLQLGDVPAALESYRNAAGRLDEPAPIIIALTAHALGRAGDTDGARAHYAQLRTATGSAYIAPHFLAIAAIGAGRIDEAVQWMDAALEHRSAALLYMHMEPLIDPLRDHPRFRDLVRRTDSLITRTR